MKHIAIILLSLFASASYCWSQHDTYSLLLVNGKLLSPFDSEVQIQVEIGARTLSLAYNSTTGFHLDSLTCAFLQSMPDSSRIDLQLTLYKNLIRHNYVKDIYQMCNCLNNNYVLSLY